MRIVSLIASATETLCRLGLRDHLVGRSHECDFPPDVATLPVLSAPKVDGSRPGAEVDRDVRALVSEALSVYQIDVDTLQQLAPDLIVTQDHCDVCAVSLRDVEAALCQFSSPHTTVCTLHPNNLEDVYTDIQRVADAAGVTARGEKLTRDMQERIDNVARRAAAADRRPRVALIEWLEPPMIAGGWMPQLAHAAGADPVIVNDAESFATVDWSAIADAHPDVAVVLPCGYELPQTRAALHDAALRAQFGGLDAVRAGRGFLADGNAYFNRPGPRLADSCELLAAMAHPGLFPEFVEQYRASYVTWPNDAAP